MVHELIACMVERYNIRNRYNSLKQELPGCFRVLESSRVRASRGHRQLARNNERVSAPFVWPREVTLAVDAEARYYMGLPSGRGGHLARITRTNPSEARERLRRIERIISIQPQLYNVLPSRAVVCCLLLLY